VSKETPWITTATAGLSEPSRRYNHPTAPAASASNGASSMTTVNRLPKMTETERKLLLDNEGCLKCRKFFAGHRSNNCPNGFLNAGTYRTLSNDDVNAARRPTSNAIASITGPTTSVEATAFPVAAVFPPSNRSCVLDMSNGDLSKDSDDDVSGPTIPFSIPHFLWKCLVKGQLSGDDVLLTGLLDDGSHVVLIKASVADILGLRCRKLPKPMPITQALSNSNSCADSFLFEWVKLKPRDIGGSWSSRTVRAIVAENLCADIILGLPFLCVNKLVMDYENGTCIDKASGFDILHPTSPVRETAKTPLQQKHRELQKTIRGDRKSMLEELSNVTTDRQKACNASAEAVKKFDVVGAVRTRIEQLAHQDYLDKLGKEVRTEFTDVFNELPHVDRLSESIYCKIKLKDADRTIATRSYSCPRKYRESWKMLIQQHLDAGRIQLSSSPHASPAFIIPKKDPTVLPRWVNDYRQLNSNTVTDSFPIPRVDDVIADAAKGKIWSVLDMTNSFFHTRVEPESIPLTAITTLFGLYEWLVMPMGLKNAPPIHQRRVTNALRDHIGKICHVYMDDIIIWSETIAEHAEHVRMIMHCMREHGLCLNEKKSKFFLLEVNFLGHHISRRGVEASNEHVVKILDWPTPKSASQVRAFLGIVRYIAAFLPALAEHTQVLTPLTMKDCDKDFPEWTADHQAAMKAIKDLVVSRECLTVIDHDNPGTNKIYVTTDASDFCTGAVLSWGPTWETARPVSFDSMQLNKAQRRYPVHEKELLVIVRALKKWRSDLLGEEIYVYTDHKTLENFETQKELSRRQARWQEFMAQFDMRIIYIKGEDNTVADALSRLPNEDVEKSDELSRLADNEEHGTDKEPWGAWSARPTASVSVVEMDKSVLKGVREGYEKDEFCKKIVNNDCKTLGITSKDGLWYIGGRLLIPRNGDMREQLFRLAHDTLGHFGGDKAYAALRNSYYWPNMRRDLELAYIPSCEECQRNKSLTHKPRGPLHPLPVPDRRGASVAMDFIGPLPEDRGYNCILSMTDRLGADLRIVPTRTTINAKELAAEFFEHWYCENGLLEEVISDCDKLFISEFWHALHKLTGVWLKMSTAYHPESDGSSERTNKTVNQCIRYHVERNQKGWVKALPMVRFNIMNTVNASTGYSNFELHLG
jgi:hypothetical protein